MGVSYVEPKQVAEYAKQMQNIGADIFYIADSFGALMPQQVKEYMEQILEHVTCDVGFHAHNNLGLAFCNTLQAIDSGAGYVDMSLCGMARGAGNLATEQFISVIQNENYNVWDVLEASDYVLEQILKQPISVSKKEIECGLYNIHYYFYDLLQSECRKNKIDTYMAGKLLGKLKPKKVDYRYVINAIEKIRSKEHDNL